MTQKMLFKIHPVIMAVPAADQRLVGRGRVQALSRLARLALAESAALSGFSLGPLLKNEKGVPQPSNGVYWSLTHKIAYVGAVASPTPVGIDIEKLRPCNPALYQRIAREDEWALAPEVIDDWFYRFWTAKEAVLKAVGTGLTGLSDCRIKNVLDEAHIQVSFKQILWVVEQHQVGKDHLASLAATGVEACWQEMDPAGSCRKL